MKAERNRRAKFHFGTDSRKSRWVGRRSGANGHLLSPWLALPHAAVPIKLQTPGSLSPLQSPCFYRRCKLHDPIPVANSPLNNVHFTDGRKSCCTWQLGQMVVLAPFFPILLRPVFIMCRNLHNFPFRS